METCKLICLICGILTFLSAQGFSQTIQPFVPAVRSVTSGQQVTLDCTVINTNDQANVVWYHDNNVISFGDSLLVDRNGAYGFEVVPETNEPTTYHWVLTINSLQSSRDMGTWSCRLSISTTQSISQDVELVIQGPPVLTHVTGDLIPNVGSDVTLQCNASGYPAPGITWSRSYPQPFLLMSDGSKRSFKRTTSSNTVQLTNVNSAHRGHYACAVTNGVDDPIIMTTYVQLPYIPEVRASLKWVRVIEGMEAVLACVSQAYPPTDRSGDVMWMKDGQEVESTVGSVNIQRHPEDFYGERYYSRLTIDRVGIEHEGTYSCQFTNSEGTGSATVQLGLEPLIDPNFGANP